MARAQAWPTRPIELIVPYPTGASVDFTARLVQPRLAATLGQSVVVENRGGAGGNIGSAYVAKSAPDGYRILLTTNAVMVINPHVYRNMGFDALKDLTPLTLAVNGPLGIAVAATSPIQSLADLIAFAKRNPGKLSFGTPGSGSPQHVVGELLKQRAGMFMVHIPYRGVGPVITDVIGGSVDVVISTLSALTPQASAGRLRVLALCEAKRLESAPNIPVVAETLAGFEASAWLAFFAPAGSPREVVQKLNAALVGAINAEDVRSKLIGSALAPAPGTPEQLGKLVRDEHERWGRIIRERNITAD
jgi:tripartite-type tricarboxylate transporter receptor subunit TctC